MVGIYRGKSTKESAETVEIVSSQSPHKRLDPTSDDGRAKLQTRIDSMADVFVSTIARNRSVTPDHVLEHYGGGDVMIGANAVNAGLADRIGSLERLITELSSPKTQSPPQKVSLISDVLGYKQVAIVQEAHSATSSSKSARSTRQSWLRSSASKGPAPHSFSPIETTAESTSRPW